MKTLNERAQWALDQTGLTSRQIARIIDVSPSWVSRVATNRDVAHVTVSPDAASLLRFARACKVDLIWLISGEGSPRQGTATAHAMTPFDVGAAAARLDGATAADVEKARAELGTKGVTWQTARDCVMYHRAAREHGLAPTSFDPSVLQALQGVAEALKSAKPASTPPARKRRR